MFSPSWEDMGMGWMHEPAWWAVIMSALAILVSVLSMRMSLRSAEKIAELSVVPWRIEPSGDSRGVMYVVTNVGPDAYDVTVEPEDPAMFGLFDSKEYALLKHGESREFMAVAVGPMDGDRNVVISWRPSVRGKSRSFALQLPRR